MFVLLVCLHSKYSYNKYYKYNNKKSLNMSREYTRFTNLYLATSDLSWFLSYLSL